MKERILYLIETAFVFGLGMIIKPVVWLINRTSQK